MNSYVSSKVHKKTTMLNKNGSEKFKLINSDYFYTAYWNTSKEKLQYV